MTESIQEGVVENPTYSEVIEHKAFYSERALYGIHYSLIKHCGFGRFDEDSYEVVDIETPEVEPESAIKECRNFKVEHSVFRMRYCVWHALNYVLEHSRFDVEARAPMWYCSHGKLEHCEILTDKLIRECLDIELNDCKIISEEFAWQSSSLKLKNCEITSVYPFLSSSHIEMQNVKIDGKYALQYTEDVYMENCSIDTKDAFWHARNVTLKNCVIKTEYLGWYSDGLTLIDCQIESLQPLCYCRNLKLVNCTMADSDRAFEYSDVNGSIKGGIVSIKNLRSGKLVVDSVGSFFHEKLVMACTGEVYLSDGSQVLPEHKA